MRNLRISLLVLWCLVLPAVLWAVNTTIYRVPSTSGTGAATYQTDLDTFLRQEDAARQGELGLFPQGVVAQNGGGLHATAASMTSPPFATIAYTSAGNRLAQPSTSINYATQGCATNGTAWVIASGQTATTVGTFQRVPGTIYYTDCSSGPSAAPNLPADSLALMQVSLAGAQIAAVADIAVRSVATGGGSSQTACVTGSTVGVPDVGDVIIDATVGGIAVLAANVKRCQALITNNGAGDMRCAPDTYTVSASVGYPIKAGQTLALGVEGSTAWRCIRTTATTTVAAILYAVNP